MRLPSKKDNILSRLYTKEDTEISNRQITRSSTSFAIRKMQIKIMRHFRIKNLELDWKYIDLSYITGGNGKCYSHFGKHRKFL